jgi:hypothetical protein
VSDFGMFLRYWEDRMDKCARMGDESEFSQGCGMDGI